MDTFSQELDGAITNIQHIVPEFCRRSQEIIQQMDRSMNSSMEKTQRFLNKFESDINALVNQKMRDNESIYRIKKDLDHRKSRSELINRAYEMEQGLTYQYEESVKNLSELSKHLKEEQSKIAWGTNQLEVRTQKVKGQFLQQQRCRKYSSLIKIDKKSSKIIIKLNREQLQKNLPGSQKQLISEQSFQIVYNQQQDRYMSQNRKISAAVLEFNFHRNLKKLYDEIMISYVDSVINGLKRNEDLV